MLIKLIIGYYMGYINAAVARDNLAANKIHDFVKRDNPLPKQKNKRGFSRLVFEWADLVCLFVLVLFPLSFV